MAYLYELTNDYLRIQEYISSFSGEDLEEGEDDSLQELLDSLNDDIADKFEGLLKVKKHIEYDMAAHKAEEERLAKRRKSLEKNADRIETTIKNAMLLTGLTSVKAGLFTVSIRNNAPALVIYDETKIPSEYLKPQPPTVDKKGIKAAIKLGQTIEGAALGESTKSLTIK